MRNPHLHTRNRRAERLHPVEWGVALSAALLLVFFAVIPAASSQLPAQSEVVISKVYGGSEMPGATFRNDFIELFNRSNRTINLSGWSVQFAAANSNRWQLTELTGLLAPGQYYLVQQAAGFGNIALPEPDASGTLQLHPSTGKVALVRNTTPLNIATGCAADPNVVDLVGYGNAASCFEGSARAPAPSQTLAIARRGNGCTDQNQNSADFLTAPPHPRNTTANFNPCHGIGTQQADLVVNTQTSNASLTAREMVRFLISLTNAGPSPATNVNTTFQLPPGLTNVRVSGGGTINGLLVSWPTLPTLNPGAVANYTITATAPATGGVFTGVARVTSDTYDPQPRNNRSSVSFTVRAGARFRSEDIRVTLSDPSNCNAAYRVDTQITNSGVTTQGDNPGAEFVAYLSAEVVTLGSCTASKGVCRTTPESRIVSWNGTIAPGETVTISYGVAAVAPPPPRSQLAFEIETLVNYDSDNDGTNDATTIVKTGGEFVCSSGDRGLPFPASSELSDQKAGSILVYNFYTSSASEPQRENTRLNLTNTNTSIAASVHLFFVSAQDCTVFDAYVCLTPNQTMTILASDIDPGVTGYLIAMAVNAQTGCPINFNHLIGDEYFKLASGHAANLGAEAFAAIAPTPVVCEAGATSAVVAFDGLRYNQAPQVLLASSVPSAEDGNSTLLVVNRLGGDLLTNVPPLGVLEGWLFDDQEQGFSFVATGNCQLRQVLSNNFPRVTPRFTQVIPSGHTGWLRLASSNPNTGLLGAIINRNVNQAASATAYNGGRNLHKVRLAPTVTLIVPIFPPHC